MGNFKYFTDAELAGLVDNLPAMLDMAHGQANLLMQKATGDPKAYVVFRLTFTTGGQHCGNSAHYQGKAVDIGLGTLDAGFARDTQRWAIVGGLYAAGFQRIEICELHVHADTGAPPDFVTPTMWIGKDT